jgi:predicted proteasome-type protease
MTYCLAMKVDSGFYERFRAAWQHGMEAAFRQLPAFDRE